MSSQCCRSSLFAAALCQLFFGEPLVVAITSVGSPVHLDYLCAKQGELCTPERHFGEAPLHAGRRLPWSMGLSSARILCGYMRSFVATVSPTVWPHFKRI